MQLLPAFWVLFLHCFCIAYAKGKPSTLFSGSLNSVHRAFIVAYCKKWNERNTQFGFYFSANTQAVIV